MVHVVSYQSALLVTAKAHLECERSGYMAPTGKSETALAIGGVTRRNDTSPDTPGRSIKQTSHGLITRSICIHGISGFISRESSFLSYLSPSLVYLRRYSSPPLNERLIPCLSVLFVAFFPLAFSGDRLPACLLARTVTSLASASLFSTLSPRHISRHGAASSFFLVVCLADFPLPRPASILSPIIPAPALSLRARENEWRETTVARDRKSRRSSLHTANPSFFLGSHRLVHRAR